jgi:hypothetical protein
VIRCTVKRLPCNCDSMNVAVEWHSPKHTKPRWKAH